MTHCKSFAAEARVLVRWQTLDELMDEPVREVWSEHRPRAEELREQVEPVQQDVVVLRGEVLVEQVPRDVLRQLLREHTGRHRSRVNGVLHHPREQREVVSGHRAAARRRDVRLGQCREDQTSGRGINARDLIQHIVELRASSGVLRGDQHPNRRRQNVNGELIGCDLPTNQRFHNDNGL
jgi:hypothetical protein